MGKITVLWAVKVGDPDAYEVLITEDGSKIEEAKKWAAANGFDRFRVAHIDLSDPSLFDSKIII